MQTALQHHLIICTKDVIPGDKRKFYDEIFDHLIIEQKSVQDEAYPFPVLNDAYCCTYTRLYSLLYSHMHPVTQTLPEEP